MKKVTFITGNQAKADYLAKYLGHPVEHQKLDLDEIQTLDHQKLVEHKVRQAFDILKRPVLVDDVSLSFEAFGRLPGTFIKFFEKEMSFQDICDMLNDKSRRATASCVYGYYDGNTLKIFERKLGGEIAHEPAGDGGFGWDKIFIPDGYKVTRASLSEEDDRKTYLQIKPLDEVKEFLERMN